ncbi:MAG: 16S rRNA (cytosine(967)-C(5))-methyltransferase RsmB [Lachnospiraceae bacterium]|nr:16S rRNA (cytosine(967)-C(5))-methyltransferase RsmB [Lachnospiraceae bacterium]
MGKRKTARDLAWDALARVLEGAEPSHEVMSASLADPQAPQEDRDRRFFVQLFEGTLERLPALDDALSRVCSRPLEKQKPVFRTGLRLAAYQILYLDSVPDRAAVSETLAGLERRKLGGLKNAANGILRALSREKAGMTLPPREEDPVRHLSLAAAASPWLTEKLIEEYGYDAAQIALLSSLGPAPVTARAVRGTAKEAVERLRAQGAQAQEVIGQPGALWIRPEGDLSAMGPVADGSVIVQDLSSQLAGYAADIQPGMTVIDVCAAPGGKSLHAAQLLGGSGKVIAMDISDRRLERLRENAARTGLPLTVRVHDGREAAPDLAGCADVVLCDVPCSGTGVIRRKKEIKYRVTPEQIDSLIPLQRQIVSAAVHYLKPGGRLVYSTCSILPEEDDGQRSWILENLPVSPLSLKGLLPPAAEDGLRENGTFLRLPGESPGDGFYIAVFRKEQA